jgi:hypothetical protein
MDGANWWMPPSALQLSALRADSARSNRSMFSRKSVQ